jgi:hypothetical protein
MEVSSSSNEEMEQDLDIMKTNKEKHTVEGLRSLVRPIRHHDTGCRGNSGEGDTICVQHSMTSDGERTDEVRTALMSLPAATCCCVLRT